MSIRTGVVVAVTFQQVDDTPDAETSAQSDNEGLKNGDIQVQVKGTLPDGYQIINRSDVGGQYLNEWQTATSNWVTIVRRFQPVTPLPKTGY